MSRRAPPSFDDEATAQRGDDAKTSIYDSQAARRAKSATRRGHHQQVEQPTPTDIDPLPPAPERGDRSEPFRVISMKTPAELAADKRAAKQHKVKLRSMDEVHKRTPPGGLGYLAPPRDAREVRARRVRDYLIWGSAVIIVGCAVMLAVWLVAAR